MTTSLTELAPGISPLTSSSGEAAILCTTAGRMTTSAVAATLNSVVLLEDE